MKKALILLSLILVSLASASPTLQFRNEETQIGETILSTISTTGTFEKQIENSDIKFYEGRKETSFDFDIEFYEDKFYLAVYTTRQGNFSIQIQNVLYKEVDELKETTLTKNFEIKNQPFLNEETNKTETQILSIKPGLIYTSKTPQVKLINKGIINLSIEYKDNQIILQPLETKTISYIPNETFSYLKFETYKEFKIPIIYPPANSIFETPIIQLDLKSNPDLLLVHTYTNNKSQETIELFNFGEENITISSIISDLDFITTKEYEQTIPARQIKNITLNLDPKTEGHFQGNINITYIQKEKENKLKIPLSIFVLQEGSDPEEFTQTEETCEALNGQVCQGEERCKGGKEKFTSDGKFCCLATCEIPETDDKGSGFGWLVGIVIIIILGLGAFYFYKKQKKLKTEKPEDRLKKASENYSKRLSGKSSNRITGSLSKN